MSRIAYAVIALKRNEVDSVVRELKAKNMNAIAVWLDQRKDTIYGRRSEDWKPFMGQTISQILNPPPFNDYRSETNLIDAIDEEGTNINILVNSKIEVFFVDIFALFFQRYKLLASRLDLYLSETRKCCLVMPYGLTDDSSFIISAYNQVWRAVSSAYLNGVFHPTLLRADDLTHLRNYVLTLPRLEDSPIPDNIKQMSQRFGPALQKPQLG
jgi:hypothetical protein